MKFPCEGDFWHCHLLLINWEPQTICFRPNRGQKKRKSQSATFCATYCITTSWIEHKKFDFPYELMRMPIIAFRGLEIAKKRGCYSFFLSAVTNSGNLKILLSPIWSSWSSLTCQLTLRSHSHQQWGEKKLILDLILYTGFPL